MSSDTARSWEPRRDKPWWHEVEVAGLLLLVLAAYFLRAGALPLRGEEPTRAQIAFEMVERGDWLVPRIQGEPFLIRPPLQNWLIAANCSAFGTWDVWSIRFSSVLATLLTTLLIYGYSRTFLARPGALAAGAAFATLADMFQMGRQAETEAIFIFLVSASLFTWHWGFVRRWPDALTWSLGYGFMALAMLTKGLQAPTYFVGAVGVYLVLTGAWRRLFSVGHVLGALVGVLIIGLWNIPYANALGWPSARSVWTGDPALHIWTWIPSEVALHLLTYPLEIAAGTLPWSLLLLLYLHRDFRRSIGAARPQVVFLIVSLAVAFPTCWIPPGGQPRFFAPLFPALAVLIGLAIQRCAEAEPSSLLRTAWRWYLTLIACIMVAAAVATVVAATCFVGHPILSPWAEPVLVALAYAAISLGLAFLIFRIRAGGSPARVRLAVIALACFLVLTFTGVLTDIRLRRSESMAEPVKRLKEQLPPGQQLVSFDGYTDCLFSYHYGLPIIKRGKWPTPGNDPDANLTYFCFAYPGDSRPQLPFAWEELAAISLDRNHHANPERVLIVGRRRQAAPPALALEGAKSTDTGLQTPSE